MSLARQLTDLPVQLQVPLTLPLHCPHFEHHRVALAALFEAGVLPRLRRRPRESPLAYTRRALETWGETHHRSLEIHLDGAEVVLEECVDYFRYGNSDLQPEVDASELIIRAYGPDAELFSAADFLDCTQRIHPALGGSLLAHLGRVSGSGFGIFTPDQAWDLAESHYFCCDQGEFWQMQREAAADGLEKPVAELTNAELKTFIRAQGILTPGSFKRQIGLDVFQAGQQPLSLEAIHAVLAAAPITASQRQQFDQLLTGLMELSALTARLDEVSGDETSLLKRMHQAPHGRMAVVLEIWPWERLEHRWGPLQELLREYDDQRMQGNELEGPNFAMFLTARSDSASRFQEATELINDALMLTLQLAHLVGAWTA
ncbi:hypothetical protein [Deinococcus multiflagellatus]|uniref:PRTRC system protein F n=1 Tax=Deinococcus multiflagellatus TaxID=1656887 RepID=A0ABW1ZPK8_9DEIO|nr:hypothetical protein [Deinococcus multiflagellatus]MBZ9714885.1 hypothetical protein [Deinococcus multiflagellatus]